MNIKIRTMKTGDLPAVAILCGELGYGDRADSLAGRFPALARDPDHGLYVAVDDAGGVVGFIHVSARRTLHTDAAAQVLAMAVAEKRRRQGIGSALLAEAEAWAAERGLASVMLYSADRHHDAHGFYAALGYRPAVGLARYDKALIAAAKRRKA